MICIPPPSSVISIGRVREALLRQAPADRLLIRPGGDDAVGPLRPDAVDLLQTLGLLLDDIEHRFAERPDQLLGIDRPDAL
jgi:hypothetical protein